MNLELLHRPLEIKDLEFRVQSINKGGYARLLVYKDARCDMNILDKAVGPLNWKKAYTRDNRNCIVSIYDPNKKEWISKEDVGTESASEAQKGLASDSFKRACFNWGIGRELYAYPPIDVKLNQNEEKNIYGEWYMDGDKPKQGYGLKLKEWKWVSKFSDEGELLVLAGKDHNGKLRYQYGDLKLLTK